MAHPLPTVTLALTAAASAFLTIVAVRAWRRTGRRTLGFVAAAFAVFLLKSLLTLWDLQTGVLGHETSEMVASILDLVILGLLIVPLLWRT